MFRTVPYSETLAETMHVTRALPRIQPRPVQRLLAALAAAATVLSLLAATAMPARADDRDVARALAAIAAIAIIANQIDRNKDKPKAKPDPVWHDKPKGWDRGHGNGYDRDRNPRHGTSARVPGVCAIEIEGDRRRSVTVYAERCLRQQGFSYRLPQSCARNVRIYGRTDRVYSEQCLQNAGFRTSGRR